MQLPSASRYAWPTTLFLFVLAATPIFGCVTPFVAASAAAAGTMERRAGALTVLACWTANQAMGFGFMGYPVDGYAIGWGAAIAGGAMLAWVAARLVARKGATLVQIAGGAALGFIAYEGALYMVALAFGGLGTFTPKIVLTILANDALWLAVLMTAYAVLSSSAPQLFGRRLRLA